MVVKEPVIFTGNAAVYINQSDERGLKIFLALPFGSDPY